MRIIRWQTGFHKAHDRKLNATTSVLAMTCDIRCLLLYFTKHAQHTAGEGVIKYQFLITGIVSKAYLQCDRKCQSWQPKIQMDVLHR